MKPKRYRCLTPLLRVIPKALSVKNFKCLRDVRVPLSKLNVVIGPNGSGKSSLIEAVLLSKLILEYVRGRVINPFLHWWSYRDAVWKHDEKLNVELCFEYSLTWCPEDDIERELLRNLWNRSSLELSRVCCKITVSGRGGAFKILEERLAIPELGFELCCAGSSTMLLQRGGKQSPEGASLPRLGVLGAALDVFKALGEDWERPHVVDELVTTIFENYALTGDRGLDLAASASMAGAFLLIDRSVVLLPEAAFRAREPCPAVRSYNLSPYGDNLAAVILTRYKGRIPEHVRDTLSYILGSEVNVEIEVTSDGRVYVRAVESGEAMNPPSMPAGLLKALAIEVASDLKSPLIAVDELENSLHIEAVHRVLDSIRSSESVLLATTHSPAVIDLASPAEVIVMEKRGLEATAKRFEDPEELSRKLRELGVTLSEYLAYVAPS